MDLIRDEMAKSKGWEVQAVGEMVTASLRAHPEWGEKIAGAKGKTLKGLFDKMKAVAAKKQKDRCYMMSPEEAGKLMLEYYGIDAQMDAQAPADGGTTSSVPPVAGHLPLKGKASGDTGMDLDALLEGL